MPSAPSGWLALCVAPGRTTGACGDATLMACGVVANPVRSRPRLRCLWDLPEDYVAVLAARRQEAVRGVVPEKARDVVSMALLVVLQDLRIGLYRLHGVFLGVRPDVDSAVPS